MPSTALSNLEPSAAVGILVQLLGSASAGNDVSSVVPELIQYVFSRPGSSAHVRKLAYEVCRHANLSESDCGRLWESVANDANCSDPEVVAAALRFLTCVPPSELANRLVVGQVAELLVPCLSAEAAVVRAAAVQTLCHVLLLPEVQQAAAGSQGLAHAYEGLWDALTDSLLDERPFVVGLAAAATAQLLALGIDDDVGSFSSSGAGTTGSSPSPSAGTTSPAGFMMSRLADRAAQRLATALGPVLETCGLVPAPGQVAVCDMLLALTQRMLVQTLRPAAAPPPPGIPVPTLPALVASAVSYLSTLLHSGDVAARTEACGAVLALAADLAAAGPAAAGAAAGLPQSLVLEAVQGLLELQEREMVEAGLADMGEAVAAALPALQPSARAHVLHKLWPLASRIADVSRRARVFSTAWSAAIASEMDTRTGSGEPKATDVVVSTPAPVANPLAAPSDPLAGLSAVDATAQAAAGGAAQAAQGLVTAVPASCSVSAQLGDPFVGLLLSGKVPTTDVSSAAAAAQAAAAAAASSPTGSSLINAVTSMARSAPPPPQPGPLTLARAETGLSAGGPSSPVAARSPEPTSKKADKKGGMLGGLFGRHKAKARGVTEAEAERAAEREAAAAAAAASSAAALAMQAAAQRPAPQSPPQAPNVVSSSSSPSVDGKSVAGAAAEAAALAAARTVPTSTLRHELLQCLLQQLARHPAAAAAAELCAERAAAARHDRHPPSASPSTQQHQPPGPSTAPARRLTAVAQWVAMVADVLAACAACVGWEPYVAPGITAQPCAAVAGCAPVDFNSLTGDLWLALLQAAVQAAGAVQAQLGRLVAEAVDAAAAVAVEAAELSQVTSYAGMGYGTPYGMTPLGGGLAATSVGASAPDAAAAVEGYYRGLLSHLDGKAVVLQNLIEKLLTSWPSLSAAVRPRVVWLAAHCLSLPCHWDARWEALLDALAAVLLRGTDVLTAARRLDVMGSALAGSLYKAGRQAWAEPSRPFLFDIAAASALCEAPEYETAGLLAALAAVQHLAARLLNDIAEAVPRGAAGAAHGQAAAVARRLEGLVRSFIGNGGGGGGEAAGAPHVRDWCKRVLRCLAVVMSYTPPATLPATVAALGLIAKQAHEADGTAAPAGDEDDDSSSDASSAYHPEETPQHLPPALAAAAAAAVAAATSAAAAGRATEAQGQQAQAAAAAAAAAAVPVVAGKVVTANGGGTEGGAGGPEDAGRLRGGSVAVGSSYVVHSAAAAVPMWGYPFASLSSGALHNAKRARRHRAMLQHLAAGAAAAAAPRPALAAALRSLQPPEEDGTLPGASPAAGPALSCRTAYRLDSEAFWSALPYTHTPWQELTGPADPVLLRGCFVRPDPARGDLGTITVMLSAVNRLPVEVSDLELSLKTGGPLLAAGRRGASWLLPSLGPQDRAVTSFTFKVLGYGDLQLHARLQLSPGPARTDAAPLQLSCMPLEVPPPLLLRPPQPVPDAAEFFRSWGSLPARAELNGVCTWSGPEGGALLLSSLLRQPLGCCWLQHVPALCGFQAALAAATAPGDSLALLLTTQLLPPAAPGGSPETYCSLAVRSTSHDLVLSLQSSAAAWFSHLTGGAACLGSAGRPAQPPASVAKPPLHPRVAALLQSYSASAAQLAVSAGGGGGMTSMGSVGLPAEVAAAAGGVLAKGAGGVGDAGKSWMRSAALSEWQRLNSLAV
ncbi:hypothetical protein Agub_g4660 [Astrephomene gubernaculifera]|uniref:Uncharacterized protein n=1 Tax=Astrephomene gubernaculifera TaxID=47775 RepID=A0AAD3HK49_9CHLO|nr:hypothetical protein Agub_g4660 [Astrephomene gubernaculifera]